MSTPTVVIELSRNRSTITEMISHAMPVTNSSHHGPASRQRPARASRTRSSVWVMASFSHDK